MFPFKGKMNCVMAPIKAVQTKPSDGQKQNQAEPSMHQSEITLRPDAFAGLFSCSHPFFKIKNRLNSPVIGSDLCMTQLL